MSYVETGIAFLVLFGQIGLAGYAVAYLVNRFLGEVPYLQDLNEFVYDNRYYITLVFSGLATGGSLFFSNVLGYPPCRLCWFQRIFMYPIVLLVGWGMFLRKDDMADYVIPMAAIGGGIAFYQYASQIIAKIQTSGCSIGATSCSDKLVYHFGYMTIPNMSLTAFLLIIVVLLIKKE